jgi:hypothetical protein
VTHFHHQADGFSLNAEVRKGDGQFVLLAKGRIMQIGDVIHLDGLKAEYNFCGRDRFSACTLPDGDYQIVALEDKHIKLAWTDARGCPSRKHRYRVGKAALICTGV